MNPVVQELVVAAIVLGALGYLLARFVGKRRSGKNCDVGCGCTPTTAEKPAFPPRSSDR